MCGTDWRTYELMYKAFSWENFSRNILFIEPLYVFINILFSELHVDFWIFFIILKLFIAIVLLKTLKDNCPFEFFYLALLFFLAFLGFFILIDNPMRNAIAVAITSLAIPYLFRGKVWKYYMIVFIAVLFHYSAIFMLLLYPIARCRISTKIWIIIYIAVNIIFVKTDLLYQIAGFIFSPFPFISWKVESYLTQLDTVASGKIFSIGLLIHFMFFVLILFSRKRIESIRNGKYIFNLAILFPIVFRMGLTSIVFSRFQLYVIIFYSIAICCVVYSFTLRSRLAYKMGVIVICFYSCYNLFTADFRYIPYTNYFVEKMFNRDLSYDERSNYNKTHSPYKDKTLFEE